MSSPRFFIILFAFKRLNQREAFKQELLQRLGIDYQEVETALAQMPVIVFENLSRGVMERLKEELLAISKLGADFKVTTKRDPGLPSLAWPIHSRVPESSPTLPATTLDPLPPSLPLPPALRSDSPSSSSEAPASSIPAAPLALPSTPPARDEETLSAPGLEITCPACRHRFAWPPEKTMASASPALPLSPPTPLPSPELPGSSSPPGPPLEAMPLPEFAEETNLEAEEMPAESEDFLGESDSYLEEGKESPAEKVPAAVIAPGETGSDDSPLLIPPSSHSSDSDGTRPYPAITAGEPPPGALQSGRPAKFHQTAISPDDFMDDLADIDALLEEIKLEDGKNVADTSPPPKTPGKIPPPIHPAAPTETDIFSPAPPTAKNPPSPVSPAPPSPNAASQGTPSPAASPSPPESYSVFLAKLAEAPKRQQAAKLLSEIKNISLDQASELVNRMIIPVVKGVDKTRAEEILNRFRKHQIPGRITRHS